MGSGLDRADGQDHIRGSEQQVWCCERIQELTSAQLSPQQPVGGTLGEANCILVSVKITFQWAGQ